MKKKEDKFICQGCGNHTPKWFGKCYACGLWDSIVLNENCGTVGLSNLGRALEVTKSTSEVEESALGGYRTGIEEIDRVFGGEIKNSSVVLIGGEPGIGKSTLILQIAFLIKENALYVSGEESVAQIICRAKRLNMTSDKLSIVSTNSVHDVIHTVCTSKSLKLLIIDSIQTMCLENVSSYQGGINQIKMCTNELISLAKKQKIVLFIVGHITKDGQIAGPKLLEHMVDTVLYFEGDGIMQLRILRTVKNRFGAAHEIGVFEMTMSGLKEVINPSLLFLGGSNSTNSIGSTVYAGIEGSRSLLIEIQALAIKTYMSIPRRAVVGWDLSRLSMIMAVLTSRCLLSFDNKEIYLNIAGGMKIQETAADLAISASLISALTGAKIPRKTVIFGEVALSGEVRKVGLTHLRLREAIKLGFERAIIPTENIQTKGIELIYVNNVADLKENICSE